MIHSFLLIGQSNMAGRGFINDVEPLFSPKMKMLVNGRWQDAFYPVNRDRAFSGVCLAESFADAYIKDHDAEVGLIPCADGGTSMDMWEPGGLLYTNAVNNARLAMRTSEIVGILWHQGESDCRDELRPLYMEKLEKFINAIRGELGLENIPFIMGKLGDYLSENETPHFIYVKKYAEINDAMEKVAEKMKQVGLASADGLTSNPDKLHFDAKSLRKFGLRYYEEFKKYENKDILAENKEETTISEMEKL